MKQPPSIIFLTDWAWPGSGPLQDLNILYPGKVRVLDITKEPHPAKVLSPYRFVITMLHSGRNLRALDYRAVTAFARGGGQVISCLYEYARNRGGRFSKTHIDNRRRPAMVIKTESDVTRGYAVGDRVWWYGTVGTAPDPCYDNQMVQRQILDIRPSPNVKILASSTLNGGAVMLEEKIGAGRIVAMDILSPGRPFFNSRGSTNKYLFLGNVLGGSVRYGRHYPRKLPYNAFVGEMKALAARHRKLHMQPEGRGSDGRLLWSFNLGDERNPTLYFGAALHGWEWENAFGLLRLTEVLCENPNVESLATDRLHFKIIPIQNPYGYDHYVRHNRRGVDLNRNFEYRWAAYQDFQDVTMPWDFGYKGPRAASEPETRIIQRIIRRYSPVCLLDFHTADYSLLLPPKGDQPLLASIQREIRRRLRDRYICQQPGGGAFQQVNLNQTHPYGYVEPPEPYLSYYAAAQGVRASLLVELSGNRNDVHALVMNTDTVVEISLATIKNCLRWKRK